MQINNSRKYRATYERISDCTRFPWILFKENSIAIQHKEKIVVQMPSKPVQPRAYLLDLGLLDSNLLCRLLFSFKNAIATGGGYANNSIMTMQLSLKCLHFWKEIFLDKFQRVGRNTPFQIDNKWPGTKIDGIFDGTFHIYKAKLQYWRTFSVTMRFRLSHQ